MSESTDSRKPLPHSADCEMLTHVIAEAWRLFPKSESISLEYDSYENGRYDWFLWYRGRDEVSGELLSNYIQRPTIVGILRELEAFAAKQNQPSEAVSG